MFLNLKLIFLRHLLTFIQGDPATEMLDAQPPPAALARRARRRDARPPARNPTDTL